jgi:hypothetical protein
MGRQIIELVEVLVDRIEKNGYQQRAREDDIEALYKRLNEAEGQAKHWKAARQDAIAAGELMKAEIDSLREQLADAQQQGVDAMRVEIERLRTFVGKVRLIVDGGYITMTCQIDGIIEALAELDAEPAPVAETAEGSDEG